MWQFKYQQANKSDTHSHRSTHIFYIIATSQNYELPSRCHLRRRRRRQYHVELIFATAKCFIGLDKVPKRHLYHMTWHAVIAVISIININLSNGSHKCVRVCYVQSTPVRVCANDKCATRGKTSCKKSHSHDVICNFYF